MSSYSGMTRSPTRYARLIALTKRNLARATEPALRARLQQTIDGLEARQATEARIEHPARARRARAGTGV
jgi:hypothetical protein